MKTDKFKIAIIGRANTGKSTLFNRLSESRHALISSIPHTTRDRKYAPIEWQGVSFDLIDTGGVELINRNEISEEIKKQAEFALQEANLILLMTDAKVGIVPEDRLLAKFIRKNTKPVILVANKADNKKLRQEAEVFKKLAFEDMIKVSAINGTGTGDLLDLVSAKLKKLPAKKSTSQPTDELKIAIVGKPNTGKSSLINGFLQEDRVIVSPVAFTTRESIDIPFEYQGHNFVFIDTAGLRKKRKVAASLEKAGATQSRQSIKRADIVILMTDVFQKLSAQDKMISAEIQDSAASIIILANKWDLIKDKEEKTINKFIKYYQTYFPFLSWAPIVFVSALNKKGLKQILELILKIKEERQKLITENALSKFLKVAIKKNSPKGKADRSVNRGAVKKRRPYIYHLKQEKTNPPVFSIKTDGKINLDDKYLKYLEKSLRQKFGFMATPLKIIVKK